MSITVGGKAGVRISNGVVVGPSVGVQLAGGGLTYLFRADFDSNVASPVGNPLAADVGEWAVSDTNNALHQLDGDLQWVGQGASNPSLIGTAQTRVAGLAAVFDYLVGGARPQIGWGNANVHNNTACGAQVNNLTLIASDANVGYAANLATLTSGVRYKFAVALLATGWRMWAKGGTQFADWTLVWQGNSLNFATAYPRIYSLTNQAGNNSIGFYRVATFATLGDDMIALQDVASPVGGTTYAGAGDSIIDIDITSPAVLANSAGIKFNVQDADNYWIAYFDSAGAFKVNKIVAGVADGSSPYVNVAGVISTNETRTIRVRRLGDLLNFYTGAGDLWTKRGNEISGSGFAAEADVVPDYGAGWSGANLYILPAQTAVYDALDPAVPN